MKKYQHGLVLGKFWPPHCGHEALWIHAAERCQRVTILVEQRPQEDVDVHTRAHWARHTMSLYPHVTVQVLEGDHPQAPTEHPVFWPYWISTLQKAVGAVDLIAANEPYGETLGRGLGAVWEAPDLRREGNPISGTMIRQCPWVQWERLQTVVRQAMVRRVVVLGAESTGKTVLSKHLAQFLNTEWVPEWAETAIRSGMRPDHHEAFDHFADHQERLRWMAGKQANRILVEDSCELTTAVYEEAILGTARHAMWLKAASRPPHGVIVCVPDDAETPYVRSDHRMPHLSRIQMHTRILQVLEEWGWPYIVLGGTYDERREKAEIAVAAWAAQWKKQPWSTWAQDGMQAAPPVVRPHRDYRPAPIPSTFLDQ